MITSKEASEEFLQHLKEKEKSLRTLYTYGKDLEQIRAYLGDEKILSKILVPHVSGFMKSDALLKKNSKHGLTERANDSENNQGIQNAAALGERARVYSKPSIHQGDGK